jgi:hypothetical protein
MFRRSSSEGVDQRWKGVYGVGGASLIGVGALYFVGAVLSLMIGSSPGAGQAYLLALGSHLAVSTANFVVFSLAAVLLIFGVFALYFALKGINRKVILVGAVLMGLFVVLDLAITETNSLTLVSLVHNYMLATSDAQRSALSAAANYGLTLLPIGTFFSYVISSVALLIISVVMLKGVFMRATAILGIVTGVLGTIGGFHIFTPILGVFLVPSLVMFAIWLVATGIRLSLLGRQLPEAQPSA